MKPSLGGNTKTCMMSPTSHIVRGAVAIEMAVNPLEPEKDFLEGFYLHRTLIEMIVFNTAVHA